MTRVEKRDQPAMKSYRPGGVRPVKTIANQATKTATPAANP